MPKSKNHNTNVSFWLYLAAKKIFLLCFSDLRARSVGGRGLTLQLQTFEDFFRPYIQFFNAIKNNQTTRSYILVVKGFVPFTGCL